MILIRYLLICIIGYLIVRSFVKYGEEDNSGANRKPTVKKDMSTQKKVSKEIGEYVDYEEVKKK
jgi:hypothetical protein